LHIRRKVLMEVAHVLGLSDDLRIDQFTITASALVIEVISTQPICGCPMCGQTSDQIPSRYRRVVADVPCGNRPVSLHLQVRKFFCRNTCCLRKIFTERVPELLEPSARMTNRLRSALQALGLATGAEVSARLAPKLGMQAAPTTLLRCVRSVSSPVAKTVRVLGLDDWAYKRGQIYGTILVDLERHQTIDLLPDRSKETVKAWLQQHPEIDVISRDRASSYADAAREGAPQATQVADRFHLTNNVRERLKELLDRKRTCLPFVQESTVPSTLAMLPASQEKMSLGEAAMREQEQSTSALNVAGLDQLDEGGSSRQLTAPERRRKVSREKRYVLYEDVRALRKQGLSHSAIADTLGISRPTVRRFLAAEPFPERLSSPKRQRQSIVAPSLPFLRERWQAGCHNGRQLFREAKARGYSGSRAQLERVPTEWRKQLPPSITARKRQPRPVVVPAPKRQRLSPQQASWLFVLPKEKLTPDQQRQLDQICQACKDLSLAYELSQDFLGILKERRAYELKDWIRAAKNSHITELKSFAKSVQQDYAAVYAACSLPWSQGQVEGQINRLKCLKRQMYGRAQFDLLRLRVLHAA
jgi:transposase